ncbi:hypothetical protein E2C01_020630 [Portunus trituberculatus]|uniref:Uncharacterized protein n=1 Tax=Portunus trituberculatus TaxID=210409 RepID=A0A5B7E0N7_PORTR|nr:hypothetical protein [Portunus trituberculatus]
MFSLCSGLWAPSDSTTNQLVFAANASTRASLVSPKHSFLMNAHKIFTAYSGRCVEDKRLPYAHATCLYPQHTKPNTPKSAACVPRSNTTSHLDLCRDTGHHTATHTHTHTHTHMSRRHGSCSPPGFHWCAHTTRPERTGPVPPRYVRLASFGPTGNKVCREERLPSSPSLRGEGQVGELRPYTCLPQLEKRDTEK